MTCSCRRPRALELVALVPAVGMAVAFLLPGDTTTRAQSWDIARQLFGSEDGVAADWWLLALVQAICFLGLWRWRYAPTVGAWAGLSHWLFYAVAFGLANPIGAGWAFASGFAVANGCALYLNVHRG